MALRSQSVASRYKSISKPSLQLRGFSSFSNTLVKRTNAAEDAVVDNQYDTGQISADTYRLELTKRLSRDYITPLQRVNLQEKITKVQEAVFDADVDRRYAAGEVTTDQVLKYEQDKLSTMPATDSVAYLKQQQKVQALTDKGEKEKRTSFRVSQNLAISNMPEDTSQRLYAKASEYEKLETMARADGDSQAADVFATNKNNYVQSAKRADINDLITNTSLSTSQTAEQGYGVPSADKGSQLYGKLTGQSQSVVPGGQSGAAVSGGAVSGTGYKGLSYSGGGISSPAIKNALESLDRSQNTINRLYQDKADKQSFISTYEKVVGQATGDQKTQLTIALNNLREDLKGIDNQIENTTSNAQDTVIRIQEIQAKQAASAFNQEVRRNSQLFQKAENELETAAAQGKISKQEYIQKAIALVTDKYTFSNQASDGFNQFGNDSSAESYLQKTIEMEKIHEDLINRADRINDHEFIAVDPGGKITNIMGKGLQPGDFALTDVRQLKDRGVWDSNYVRKGNSYYRVHYPGELSDASGFPLSAVTDKELAQLRGTAFIYNEKGDQEKINYATFTDEKGKPIVKSITQKDADNLTKQGILVDDPKKGLIQKPKIEPSLLLKTGAKIQETLEGVVPGFKEFGQTIRGEIPPPSIGKMVKDSKGRNIWQPFAAKPQLGFLEKPVKAVSDFFKFTNQVQNAPGNLIKGAVDKLSKTEPGKQVVNFLNAAKNNVSGFLGDTSNMLSRFFVPKAEAAASKKTGGVSQTWEDLKKMAEEIADEFGIPRAVMISQMALESARGTSNRAKTENNLFGLGAFDDATPGIASRSAEASMRYYANLIANDPRYAKAYAVKNDPVKMIAEIKRAGYAADPNYIQKIINTPEFRQYVNQPKVTPTPVVKPAVIPAVKITPTPTAPPSAQFRSRITSPIPQRDIVKSQPSSGFQFPQISMPKINIPKFTPPKISVPQFQLPKIEVPKPIQSFAQNVGQTVQKAAQNIGSFFGNLNPFKKR